MMPLTWQGTWEHGFVVYYWASEESKTERERENSGKRRILKSLLLPCLCICRGRRSSTVPFKMHHALFCFFSKGNEFGSDPKMRYDNVVKKKIQLFLFFLYNCTQNKF
jgi:hypothetical protein